LSVACRACEIRARTRLGPCEKCADIAARQRITTKEPAPAETFDPMDVLQTSLRQVRAVQRRLQVDIDNATQDDVGRLNGELGLISRSINQLVPTWQKLREAEVADAEKLTPADEEEAFVVWFGGLAPVRQRELHQRLARVMNGEAA
jgi:hypothetical protein